MGLKLKILIKKGKLTKFFGTEVDENELFFSLLQDLAKKAKNYQMGEYQSFDMKEIEKMDPVQLNTIISRKYKWTVSFL